MIEIVSWGIAIIVAIGLISWCVPSNDSSYEEKQIADEDDWMIL